jgi:hypothetical protein
LHVRIGQRVKLHDSSVGGGGNAYPLPPGWSDGEEVTVVGFDHGYTRVLGDGKETTVFIVNIDSAWDGWMGGRERTGEAVNAALVRPLETGHASMDEDGANRGAA